jgi:hypothetical protein
VVLFKHGPNVCTDLQAPRIGWCLLFSFDPEDRAWGDANVFCKLRLPNSEQSSCRANHTWGRDFELRQAEPPSERIKALTIRRF